MLLKLKVTRHTTAAELVHLGNFFSALGLNRGAHVIAEPTGEDVLAQATANGPHTPEAVIAAVEASEPPADKPKRTRRSKAEIEAEAAAKQPEPEQPAVEPEPEQPVTEPEPEPSFDAQTTAAETKPVPTAIELNNRAAMLAKKIGPDKIKEKINAYGVSLISALTDVARAELGAWIEDELAKA